MVVCPECQGEVIEKEFDSFEGIREFYCEECEIYISIQSVYMVD